MVCGLASVESGAILWNGTPIQQQADVYRQDLCYLGHLNALQESMTVDENLRFTSALGGLAPERDANKYLPILACVDAASNWYAICPRDKNAAWHCRVWRSVPHACGYLMSLTSPWTNPVSACSLI